MSRVFLRTGTVSAAVTYFTTVDGDPLIGLFDRVRGFIVVRRERKLISANNYGKKKTTGRKINETV